ncbi:hypothetical protein LY76DRAFT_427018 [Colletotrichum caudatum]|nr:hypothetical protein LY76DRAFT_427018 [Colletotrichum caudatum]
MRIWGKMACPNSWSLLKIIFSPRIAVSVFLGFVSVLLSTVATDVYPDRLLGQTGPDESTDGLTIQQRLLLGPLET